MNTNYNYEYPVIDPVTKGRYLLRTKRPKIQDQVRFQLRLALAGKQRAKRNEEVILYARE